MNRKLQERSDVRHLNFPDVWRTLPAHEFRTLRSLASARTHPLADAQAFECALRNRDARETFWMSAATHLHGVCPTDLAGGLARHRDLSECQVRSAVSSRVLRTGGTRDLGRGQRTARLAAVGGFGQGADEPSPNALCRGRLGARSGEHPLRVGLDDHRPVVDAFSVGRFSPDQGGSENPHATRSARTDSHLHSCDQRPPTRRSLARRTGLGAGGFLRHGSWLCGFSTSRFDGGGGCLLCDPRQRQPAIYPPSLPPDGLGFGSAQRPDWKADPRDFASGFSLAPAPGALLRPGDRAPFDLSDPSSGNPSRGRRRHLSTALADRTVLPLDQGTLAHQTFFREQSQRGEDANLDCGFDLLVGGHPAQATQIARHLSQKTSTFFCLPPFFKKI